MSVFGAVWNTDDICRSIKNTHSKDSRVLKISYKSYFEKKGKKKNINTVEKKYIYITSEKFYINKKRNVMSIYI